MKDSGKISILFLANIYGFQDQKIINSRFLNKRFEGPLIQSKFNLSFNFICLIFSFFENYFRGTNLNFLRCYASVRYDKSVRIQIGNDKNQEFQKVEILKDLWIFQMWRF